VICLWWAVVGVWRRSVFCGDALADETGARFNGARNETPHGFTLRARVTHLLTSALWFDDSSMPRLSIISVTGTNVGPMIAWAQYAPMSDALNIDQMVQIRKTPFSA
jgi:hypothetical protein